MNKFLLVAIALFVNQLLLAVHHITVVHIIQLVLTLLAFGWSIFAFNSKNREEVQKYAFYNIITFAIAANTFNYGFKLFNPELAEKYWLLVPAIVIVVWLLASYFVRKKFQPNAVK